MTHAPVFVHPGSGGTPKTQISIERIINIWEERSAYSKTFLDTLRLVSRAHPPHSPHPTPPSTLQAAHNPGSLADVSAGPDRPNPVF